MHQVKVTKTFTISQLELYGYFTSPDLLEKWAYPDGMSLKIPFLKAKAGGRYRWEHSLNGGTYVAEGHFVELSPDRIVQVDEVIKDPTGKVVMSDLECVITFREVGEGTVATVVQNGFKEKKDAAECQQGWEQCLAHLEQLLSGHELKRPA